MAGGPAGPATAAVAKVAIAVLSVVAFWGGMYALNLALTTPIASGVEWTGAHLGPWGQFAIGMGVIVALSVAKRIVDRRDERRRYAQDRTIHVEKRKPIPWWGWAYFVVMGSMMTIGIIGAFSERAHEPMPGSDFPPGPLSR